MAAAVQSNTTITEWELAKHNPSGKIFVVTKIERSYLFDHYGVQYGYDQCSHYFVHCGMTNQQLVKYNKPDFSPLKECWKRAKTQAWEGCNLKVGDIVSPMYGKQAGHRLRIQLFDHSDKTIGVDTYQRWYPEKYLIINCDRPVTMAMFGDNKSDFNAYLAGQVAFELS